MQASHGPLGAAPVRTADWLLVPRRDGAQRANMIVLPYAGIGASMAAALSRFVELPVAIQGVQLPGRENRLSEPGLTAMVEVVEALLPVLRPLTRQPYVLVGFSLGALIAYELASVLCAEGAPPAHLVAVACAAPQLDRFKTGLSRVDDAELLDALDRRFGGVPAAVKQSPELQQLLLPGLKADVALLDHYQWHARPPLPMPLLTIGGTADREVAPEDLALWSELVEGPAHHSRVEGGHFVAREKPAAVAAVLNAHLARSLG